jgi:hypothetical protein
MKNLLLLLVIVLSCNVLTAQYAAVSFDWEKNYFNEGQALPAEKPLLMSGPLPANVSRIEISILPGKAKKASDELYRAVWKATENAGADRYNLAVNFPLRSSEKYDFAFRFFRQIDRVEKQALREQLLTQTAALLRSSTLTNGRLLGNARRAKKILEDMDELVINLLSNYRSAEDVGFTGFSQAVKLAIDNLQQLESAAPAAAKKADAAIVGEAFGKIEDLLSVEIDQLIDKDWSVQQNTRYVDNYQTEEKQTYFSINAGYGGVYLSGKLEEVSYGASPYLGLSFPLGNSTLAPKFLRNTSLTLGAFTKNFEDEDGNEVTGFIVNRPVYLGLDYKLFQFIRFNAGAALLETNTTNIVDGVEKTNSTVFIRPFVGLSAKVDLSLGFGK